MDKHTNEAFLDFEKYKDIIEKYFSKIKVKKGTVLLREGEISRKMFFIKEGVLRACFEHKGKDITFQFFLERQAVSSYESFWNGTPSSLTIESIEPSVLYVITKQNFSKLFDENPEFKERMREVLLMRMGNYARHFMSFIRDTPKERYVTLMKEKPELLIRIPQHYIASYLGITPVSLSRIRNSVAKGGKG